MASEERTSTASLVNELLRKSYQFEFYQAVRILHSIHKSEGGLGDAATVEQETIRFRPAANMNFAASDVAAIEHRGTVEGGNGAEEAGNLNRYRVTVNFLGLYGSVSPLPAFYTEDIIAGGEGESNRRDFFDLFHHRYISLLFRCFEKYRFYLRHRRGGRDQATQWIASLGALEDRTGAEGGGGSPLPKRERLLACLGLLMQGSRSAATLERVLSHVFDGLPVAITQFVKRRAVIRMEQRARLGQVNARLGQDCTLGERVPDIAGRFRLHVGPLDFEGFIRFLPNGDRYLLLCDLMPFLLKDQLDHDLELGLQGEEIPQLDLSGDNPCRLGWSTWLGNKSGEDEAVLLTTRSRRHASGNAAANCEGI